MMRAMFAAGSLLLTVSSPSFAQMGQQGNQGYGQGYSQQGQSSQSGQMGMGGQQSEFGDQNLRGPLAMLREERMERMLPFVSALANGAFYRFKRGDDEVDIHCPARVQLQDCVNAANTLMRSLQQTGSAGVGGQSR